MLGFSTTNGPVKGEAARLIREHLRNTAKGRTTKALSSTTKKDAAFELVEA